MTREEAIKIFSVGFDQFLDRKGLTQEAAGDLIGCSKANINKIKNKKSLPCRKPFFSCPGRHDAGGNFRRRPGKKAHGKLQDRRRGRWEHRHIQGASEPFWHDGGRVRPEAKRQPEEAFRKSRHKIKKTGIIRPFLQFPFSAPLAGRLGVPAKRAARPFSKVRPP